MCLTLGSGDIVCPTHPLWTPALTGRAFLNKQIGSTSLLFLCEKKFLRNPSVLECATPKSVNKTAAINNNIAKNCETALIPRIAEIVKFGRNCEIHPEL